MVSDLTQMSDGDLAGLYAAIADEQRRRAREAGEIGALVEAAFERAFVRAGRWEPWMEGGLLFCPGELIGAGTLRHDCSFCRVGDEWSWESSDLIVDEVRHVPHRSKIAQRSISVLAVPDDTTVDLVVSRLSGGAHRLVRATSYRVRRDGLDVVATREARTDHRGRGSS